MRGSTQEFQSIGAEIGELLRATLDLLHGEKSGRPENACLAEITQTVERLQTRWEQKTFRVATLALAKTGKSTLLNALLAAEYFPASNTPETAQVVRLRCADGPAVLTVGNERVHGPEAINAHLRLLNRRIREDESPGCIDEPILSAPLAMLAEHSLAAFGLEILDTPGPNEAGTERIQQQVVQLLNDADAIVYLLDYTKLKTIDESNLLRLLAELRPALLSRCSERLFFVVNKTDQKDRNGLSPEETRDYVRRLLRKVLPTLNVESDRILATSAGNALLARLVLAGSVPDPVLEDFRKLAFGQARRSTASLPACQDAAREIFADSGVPDLERTIIRYLLSNSGRLFYQSIADDLSQSLRRAANHLLTVHGALGVNQKELELRLVTLRRELATITEGLQQVKQAAETAKEKLASWTRSEFANFASHASERIREMVSEVPPKPRGLFRIWTFIQNLRFAEDLQPIDAMTRIEELNDTIEAQLRHDFAEFQLDLEREAHVHQKAVFHTLEAALNPIAREIERRVNRTLEISLRPVDIRLSAQPFSDFRNEIVAHNRRLFVENLGVQRKTVIEPTLVRGGWCWPDRYENRPVERDVRVFRLPSTSEIEQFWQRKIRELTELSVGSAGAILDEALKKMVDRAGSEIDRYAAQFLETIRSEINQSEAGDAERQARLDEVAERQRVARTLLHILSEVETDLAELGPGTEPPITRVHGPRDSPPSVDILVITVLPEEFRAVLNVMTDHTRYRDRDLGSLYSVHLGSLASERAGVPFRVALAITGMPGNIVMATAIDPLVRRFRPRRLLLVGIAGGLGSACLGDVVIARAVTLYEYGKLDAEFSNRSDYTYQADLALVQAAQALRAKDVAQAVRAVPRPPGLSGESAVHVGVVVSGEKVVDNAEHPLFADITRRWPHAIGVEMEGAGAAWGVHALRSAGTNVGFLMIRGISDVPAFGGAGQAAGTLVRDAAKQYAADVAARFVAELVREAWPDEPEEQSD